MFKSKNLYHYAFAFGLILVASYFGNKWRQSFEPNDEYDMIKKYLLNDSPLYGFNKPKIWIHSNGEINARKWRDFQSRNTTDLNQPYINLTISSIINHCANDFNICLIDDDSFSKLIPTWDVDLKTVSDPIKSHMRDIGMLQLVYLYGGIVVPNTFLCLKNLTGLYQEGIVSNKAFVVEALNRSTDVAKQKHRLLFTPTLRMFGSEKNNGAIRELADYLRIVHLGITDPSNDMALPKQRNQFPYFTSEPEFLGNVSQWFITAIQNQQVNLIGGELIGIKTNKRKPVLIEDLMEEDFLDISTNAYGIYIPGDDMLKRIKYQWFSVMTVSEALNTNSVLSKYLKASMVQGEHYDEYKIRADDDGSKIRSVISI